MRKIIFLTVLLVAALTFSIVQHDQIVLGTAAQGIPAKDYNCPGENDGGWACDGFCAGSETREQFQEVGAQEWCRQVKQARGNSATTQNNSAPVGEALNNLPTSIRECLSNPQGSIACATDQSKCIGYGNSVTTDKAFYCSQVVSSSGEALPGGCFHYPSEPTTATEVPNCSEVNPYPFLPGSRAINSQGTNNNQNPAEVSPPPQEPAPPSMPQNQTDDSLIPDVQDISVNLDNDRVYDGTPLTGNFELAVSQNQVYYNPERYGKFENCVSGTTCVPQIQPTASVYPNECVISSLVNAYNTIAGLNNRNDQLISLQRARQVYRQSTQTNNNEAIDPLTITPILREFGMEVKYEIYDKPPDSQLSPLATRIYSDIVRSLEESRVVLVPLQTRLNNGNYLYHLVSIVGIKNGEVYLIDPGFGGGAKRVRIPVEELIKYVIGSNQQVNKTYLIRFNVPEFTQKGLTYLPSQQGILGLQNSIKKVNAQEITESQLNEERDGIVLQESGEYVFFNSQGELMGQKAISVGENEVTIKLFYDHNRNGIKDEGEDYFENLSSLRLAKEQESFGYDLSPGWNLINLPFVSEEFETADEFQQYVKSYNPSLEIIHIANYRNSSFNTSTFRSDRNQSFNSNFNLIPGQSFFLFNIGAAGHLSIPGRAFLDPVPLELTNGWNLVGIVTPNNEYTAGSLMDTMQSQGFEADIVSQFENGSYQSLVEDENTQFGNDYNIVDERGYFVRLQSKAEDAGSFVP